MSIFTSQPGALRGNFMCDSCGAGWNGGVLWHVRAYGANCQLTAKQAQANNVTQTNSHNQQEREVNQKQNAGRKLAAPFYRAGRTNRSRAHCPLILFAYPDFMLLLFDFYACRYFHFCNWIVIVQAAPRCAGPGQGCGALTGSGWLPSCSLVHLLAVGLSHRPPVRISKHVKNGFALDWRWPTPRGIQSDGRRRRRQCRTHPWKGLWLLPKPGEGS